MSTRRQFLKRIAGLAAIAAVAPKELLEPIEIAEPEIITTLKESAENEWFLSGPVGMPYSDYLAINPMVHIRNMLTWLLGNSWRLRENFENYSLEITVPDYVDLARMEMLKEIIEKYRPMGVLINYYQKNFGD